MLTHAAVSYAEMRLFETHPTWGAAGPTGSNKHNLESAMSIGMILLIIVVLMLVGAIPSWPHSRSWGYGPSGGLGLVLIIILILVVLGKI